MVFVRNCVKEQLRVSHFASNGLTPAMNIPADRALSAMHTLQASFHSFPSVEEQIRHVNIYLQFPLTTR